MGSTGTQGAHLRGDSPGASPGDPVVPNEHGWSGALKKTLGPERGTPMKLFLSPLISMLTA